MTDAPPVTPAAAPAPASVPGKTLGIVALIVTFFASLIGLILGFIARSQSKAAGVKNTPATVAIVLGFIFLIAQILFFVLGGAALFSGIFAACAELGPGVHEVNGVTYTCS
jgi:hypothetical protein